MRDRRGKKEINSNAKEKKKMIESKKIIAASQNLLESIKAFKDNLLKLIFHIWKRAPWDFSNKKKK